MSAPSNETSHNLLLSAPEFTQMIIHSDMPNHLADAPVPTVALRHYCFVAQTIQRLESQLERHRREQEDMFAHLYARQMFRERIGPLVNRYRRMNRRTASHPYIRTPSPINTPPSPQYSDNPPTTVQITPIVLAEADALNTRPPTSSPPISPTNDSPDSTTYLTAEEPELGSQERPIVIIDENDNDTIPTPQTPGPSQGILYRSTAKNSQLVCMKCLRTGHILRDCIWATPLICTNCKQAGHVHTQCRVPVCPWCKKIGHQGQDCTADGPKV